MKRSPHTDHLTKETVAIATHAASVTGTTVDRTNGEHEMFRSALILVHTGTVTDGTHTVEVQESDDNSTWTAVADAHLEGTEPAIGSADDNKVYELGYMGYKRYLRVNVTVSGAPATGGEYGALVVLYAPLRAPAH